MAEILSSSSLPPLAVENRMGPSLAMAETLSVYLEKTDFVVFGGQSINDTQFRLKQVLRQWPGPEIQLQYPCASVIEAGQTSYDGHNFTPTPLEESLGMFDDYVPSKAGYSQTVLWKEGEAVASFQIDFWTDNKPDRQAIEAKLGVLFNPGEDRSGVLLCGPKLYYSQPIRYMLLATQFVDTNAYTNEWRLRCSVRSEVDILSLRYARVLQPVVTNEVVDRNEIKT